MNGQSEMSAASERAAQSSRDARSTLREPALAKRWLRRNFGSIPFMDIFFFFGAFLMPLRWFFLFGFPWQDCCFLHFGSIPFMDIFFFFGAFLMPLRWFFLFGFPWQ